jgi:hypothetical protein
VGQGLLPFRDYGFEYPPLAVFPMLVPWAVSHTHFETTMAIAMGLCALGVQEGLRAIAGERAAWVFALAPIALGAQLRTHFDLAAAAVVVWALAMFVRDRPRWGFALLGVGGAVKLFPLLLAPVAFVWLLGRGRPRDAVAGGAWCVAVVLAAAAPVWILGAGFSSMVDFHLHRPLQLESSAAMLAVVLRSYAYVSGTNLHPDAYKSNGLIGGHTQVLMDLSTVLLIAGALLSIALAARRDDARGFVWCCGVGVLSFVALGKVLSPQYMTWLAPFAVLAVCWGEVWIAGWLSAAFALTLLEFPGRYFDLVALKPGVVGIVTARDACLLAALVATAAAAARSPTPSWARAQPGSAPR